MKRRYSPAVIRLAQENDIDLEQVKGTGKGGRITRKDLLQLIESGQTGAAQPRKEPVEPGTAPAPETARAAAAFSRCGVQTCRQLGARRSGDPPHQRAQNHRPAHGGQQA